MAIAYLLYVVVVILAPSTVRHAGWVNHCGQDYFMVFYFLEALAWIESSYLMVFEYRRRLSEEWYANQLFWSLNLLFETITVIVLRKDYMEDPFMFSLAGFNMLGNFLLVILMFRTERRTITNMRPETSENINAVLLSTEITTRM